MIEFNTDNFPIDVKFLESMGYRVSTDRTWVMVHGNLEGKGCWQLEFDYPVSAKIAGIGEAAMMIDGSGKHRTFGRYIAISQKKLVLFHELFGIK